MLAGDFDLAQTLYHSTFAKKNYFAFPRGALADNFWAKLLLANSILCGLGSASSHFGHLNDFQHLQKSLCSAGQWEFAIDDFVASESLA
jgi:hypothetical protein